VLREPGRHSIRKVHHRAVVGPRASVRLDAVRRRAAARRLGRKTAIHDELS
jgi:hypothetical protein